jgi:ABC-type uncharacterized transport system permease subunit
MEQEAFITSALYKTQSYRINLNIMGRTNIMRGERINIHKILVSITEGKRPVQSDEMVIPILVLKVYGLRIT